MEEQIEALPPDVGFLYAKVTHQLAHPWEAESLATLKALIDVSCLAEDLGPLQELLSENEVPEKFAGGDYMLYALAEDFTHLRAQVDTILAYKSSVPASPRRKIRILNPMGPQMALMSRFAMSDLIRAVVELRLSPAHRRLIACAKSLVVDVQDEEAVLQAMRSGGLKFPVLLKGGLGGGAGLSHLLAVAEKLEDVRAYRAEYLRSRGLMRKGQTQDDLVVIPSSELIQIEALVPHWPRVVHKLFITGQSIWVTRQHSIPDLGDPLFGELARRASAKGTEEPSVEEAGGPDVKLFNSAHLKALPVENMGQGVPLALDDVFADESLRRAVRHFCMSVRYLLQSQWFGIDLICNTDDGTFVVVDVNNLPSFSGVAYFPRALGELCDEGISTYDGSEFDEIERREKKIHHDLGK